ncbi:MAG: glycosyltransferase family 2 protein [Opitutales bacterium]
MQERGIHDGSMVSILIPCFNAERWIAEAIESCLEQSVSVGQIIVYDDASRDNSLAIIEKFGDQVEVIRSRRNSGGQVARNALLSRATGEWVQFLDADDFLQKRKIEADLSVLNSVSGVDIVLSSTLRKYCPEEAYGEKLVLSEESDLWSLWISWDMPQTGGFLWNKAALQRIGGWNQEWKNCQDYELSLRALKEDLRFAVIAESWEESSAVYRQWSDETVSKKNLQSVIENRSHLTLDAMRMLEESGKLSGEHKRRAGVAFFEMFRSLAGQNIEHARSFLNSIPESISLIPEGVAAPWHYRWVAACIGFVNAERIGKILRRS